jgi:hypothetical protein
MSKFWKFWTSRGVAWAFLAMGVVFAGCDLYRFATGAPATHALWISSILLNLLIAINAYDRLFLSRTYSLSVEK